MNIYNLPDDKGHFEQYGGVFIVATRKAMPNQIIKNE
jgi:hypothetical protein